MFKPANYDKIEAAGTSSPKPPEGDYACKIVGAEEVVAKSGKNMIVLSLDIATGDFANCFGEKPLKYYQMYEGEKQTSYFKSMITSLEKSNPSFKFSFDSKGYFDVKKFIGLKVGTMMKKEPYEFTDNQTGENKKVDVIKVAILKSVQSVKDHVDHKEANTTHTSTIKPDEVPDYDSDIPF